MVEAAAGECGGSAVDCPALLGSGLTALGVVTDAMREKRNLLRADKPLIRVPKKREEEAEVGGQELKVESQK
jgi:hypothetical protein